MTNNVLNNTCPNDFTVTTATSGATRTLTTSNTVANAASQAFEVISVAGTSAGDPYTRWAVGTTTQYALGIDNSDSDYLKLTTAASGATPSSATSGISITTSGAVRFASTAQFGVGRTATVTNVTGNGTYYKVALNVEEYDVQSSFDAVTNYVMTAPIAGKYLFVGNVGAWDLFSSSYETGTSRIRVNGATDDMIFVINTEQAKTGSGACGLPVFDLISLAANDTVELGVLISGGTGNNADVRGETDILHTYFYGVLFL